MTLRIVPITFGYREYPDGRQWADRRWQIERDGAIEGARGGTRIGTQYESQEEAVAYAFPEAAYPKGPKIVYVADGAVYCAACAKARFWNTSHADEEGALVGDDPHGKPEAEADRDITCDNCGDVIVAQNLCPHHGTDGYSQGDDGAFVCAICAKMPKCPQCGEPVFSVRQVYKRITRYNARRTWDKDDETYGDPVTLRAYFDAVDGDDLLVSTQTDCCGVSFTIPVPEWDGVLSYNTIPGDIAARDSD